MAPGKLTPMESMNIPVEKKQNKMPIDNTISWYVEEVFDDEC